MQTEKININVTTHKPVELHQQFTTVLGNKMGFVVKWLFEPFVFTMRNEGLHSCPRSKAARCLWIHPFSFISLSSFCKKDWISAATAWPLIELQWDCLNVKHHSNPVAPLRPMYYSSCKLLSAATLVVRLSIQLQNPLFISAAMEKRNKNLSASPLYFNKHEAAAMVAKSK